MKQVILYGHLAKKFGRHHRFDVRTPAEALRALEANHPGFRKHLLDHGDPGYHIKVGADYRDEQSVGFPIDGTIRIVPAIGGSSAAARVIIGATLIYLTWGGASSVVGAWMGGTQAGVSAATLATISNITSIGMSVGASLAIGGVSELLFAPKGAESTESPESKPSYAFNGPVNTTSQGNPVPICYGRARVGSQVVSARLSTAQVAL